MNFEKIQNTIAKELQVLQVTEITKNLTKDIKLATKAYYKLSDFIENLQWKLSLPKDIQQDYSCILKNF